MKSTIAKAAIRLSLGLLGLLQIAAAYAVVFWVFRNFSRVTVDRTGIKGLKPPFIVLGNHTSNLDPAFVQIAVARYPCYFLTSSFYFRGPVVGKILSLFGAIPKIQFSPDIRSTRGALAVLARGDVVGVFPEGRRSIDGSCGPVPDSLARFIKKAAVPVVFVKTNGGYLTWPRWSVFRRPGQIEITAKLLFTVAQIRAMDTSHIQNLVCKEMAYSDYEWNRRTKSVFRHLKAAEGLHRILHQCPRCLGERRMRSKGISLYCSECGNAALVDQYGFFHPADDKCLVFTDPVSWTAWQRDNLRVVLGDSDFYIQAVVKELFVADKFHGAYHSCGQGHLCLRREGIYLHGTVDGKSRDLFFPIGLLPSVSTEFSYDFEICDEKNAWWIFLEEEQQTVRLESALALLHQKSGSKIGCEKPPY